MQNIAQKILAASGLPAHPVPFGDPYVMHLFLADFVYHRLIRMSVTNLAVQPQTGSNEFVLSSGSTNAAAGSKVQMDALLDIVDKAIQDNRVRAGELQDELKKRSAHRSYVNSALPLPPKSSTAGAYLSAFSETAQVI